VGGVAGMSVAISAAFVILGAPAYRCAHAGYLLALRVIASAAKQSIFLRTKVRLQLQCDRARRDGQINSDFPKSCQARESKIFRFRIHPNQLHNAARLPRMRGARERHERAVRCDGRGWCDRRARRKRTAKSCGSGAAVLALSFTGYLVERRRQKSRSPGSARSKP